MNNINITPNPFKKLKDFQIEELRIYTEKTIDNMLSDQADGFSIDLNLLQSLQYQIRLMDIELNENRFLM